jgi:protease-4
MTNDPHNINGSETPGLAPGLTPPPLPPSPPRVPLGSLGQDSRPPRKSHKGVFIALGILAFFFVCIVGLVALLINAATGIFTDSPRSASPRRLGNSIALLRIETPIFGSEEVLEVIRHYRDQHKIRAVLVRIDSPGGTVGASQEIYEALLDLRASGKTVVASFGNTAASGGYYIASAADEIVSNPGALTGSIGVIFSIPNIEELGNKIGISQQVVKSGRFKDIGSMTREMRPDEIELLQNIIDDTHDQFIEAILENRSEQIAEALKQLKASGGETAAELGDINTPEDFLRLIADGRVFTGRQALEFGLVDRLGSIDAAFDRVGELCDMSEPEIYEYKPPRSIFDMFGAETRSLLGRGVLGVVPGGGRLEYRMP